MDRGHISSPSFFSSFFVFGDLKIVTQELWCLCKASSDFWASKNLFRVVFCVLKTAEGSHRNRCLKVTATNLIFRLQLNMTRAALLPHQKGGEKPEQQHKSLQGAIGRPAARPISATSTQDQSPVPHTKQNLQTINRISRNPSLI